MRRPGGVDQYPDVSVTWKLHHAPTLFVYDKAGHTVTKVDLSPLKTEALHALFAKHFKRVKVDPPHPAVRTWRRLFGWAYGISDLEATLLFCSAGIVLVLVCYLVCCKYTACCDAISDL